MATSFYEIYTRFLGKVTDDMYMETTLEETFADLEELFETSVSNFQFPRFGIYDWDRDVITMEDPDTGEVISRGAYNFNLTHEEIDILAELMLLEWLGRQIATVNLIKMRYSTQDFKFTSQANHIQRLVAMKDNFYKQNQRRQRMYQRRMMDAQGNVFANYDGLSGNETK